MSNLSTEQYDAHALKPLTTRQRNRLAKLASNSTWIDEQYHNCTVTFLFENTSDTGNRLTFNIVMSTLTGKVTESTGSQNGVTLIKEKRYLMGHVKPATK